MMLNDAILRGQEVFVAVEAALTRPPWTNKAFTALRDARAPGKLESNVAALEDLTAQAGDDDPLIEDYRLALALVRRDVSADRLIYLRWARKQAQSLASRKCSNNTAFAFLLRYKYALEAAGVANGLYDLKQSVASKVDSFPQADRVDFYYQWLAEIFDDHCQLEDVVREVLAETK